MLRGNWVKVYTAHIAGVSLTLLAVDRLTNRVGSTFPCAVNYE